MEAIDKGKVITEIKELYNDIDKCISELIAARGNHDGNGISNAHWRMETLMVNTQQAICNVIDTFETKEEEDTFIDKACEWLSNHVNDYIINDKYILPNGKMSRDWLKIKSDMFGDFRKYMKEK